MDVIFLKESKKFLDALTNYSNGLITYSELSEFRIRYEASKFEDIQHMRDLLHNFKLKEYKKSLEYEKILQNIETNKNMNDFEMCVCVNKILQRGEVLGLTIKSEYGSILPAFPTLNMMSLDTKEEESKQDDKTEDFMFEF